MLHNTNKFNVLSHTLMPLLASIVAFTFVPIFMIGNKNTPFSDIIYIVIIVLIALIALK